MKKIPKTIQVDLNLKDVKAHCYQANGGGVHSVEYIHNPTGIFVAGADTSIRRLRRRLLTELAEKVKIAEAVTRATLAERERCFAQFKESKIVEEAILNERERCAKVCDNGVDTEHPTVKGHIMKRFGASTLLAKAIRKGE